MKHRIRVAPIEDGKQPSEVTFVEVRPDFWLEVNGTPEELRANPAGIKQLAADSIRVPGKGSPLGFAGRAFSIGLIRNWTEAGEVETV